MVTKASILIVAVFLTTLVWTAALSFPDGRYHLWVLGDKTSLSLVIRGGQGGVILINPRSTSTYWETLGRILPFYQRQIDTVVLTDTGSESRLNDLRQRYQVKEVWSTEDYQNQSKDYKLRLFNGSEEVKNLGLTWSIWSITGQGAVIRLDYGSSNLTFASKGSTVFWETVPWSDSSQVLIGPVVSGSSWSGEALLRKYQPDLLITNKAVSGQVPKLIVVGEREIVWDSSSWYIGSSHDN